MRLFHIILTVFLISSAVGSGYSQNVLQQDMLEKINNLRAKGCNCSGDFMRPVPPLVWSSTLMTSALFHAKDMNRKNYFSHYSPNGNDIGDRLDKVGYKWSYCGENLGVGQNNFDEVLEDWIESQSHCKMLMNPEVEEVAVASKGKYWVQHFGRRFDEEIFRSN